MVKCSFLYINGSKSGVFRTDQRDLELLRLVQREEVVLVLEQHCGLGRNLVSQGLRENSSNPVRLKFKVFFLGVSHVCPEPVLANDRVCIMPR